MTWNYRIIKRHYDESDITSFAIHEVYYNEDQSIDVWSKDPMAPNGETIAELKEDLMHFQEALRKPVLVEKTEGGKTVLVEDIPNKVPSSFESPFDVGGVKTKATTQDILDAIKDSRSRKGKK